MRGLGPRTPRVPSAPEEPPYGFIDPSGLPPVAYVPDLPTHGSLPDLEWLFCRGVGPFLFFAFQYRYKGPLVFPVGTLDCATGRDSPSREVGLTF